MTIIYLLSNIINYNLLICDDAGPGYALSMNWKPVYLDQLRSINNDHIYVIDNRLTTHELESLHTFIINSPKARFFLKIVDPFFDNNINHYYYKFLLQLSVLKNIYLLSIYEPTEITAELKEKSKNRFIHLPYPYLKSKEINSAHKKNKIVISGSMNELIYPYRYSIWIKVTRSLSRLFFFSILKHPGYAELSHQEAQHHKIIKENFINYISRFKYMLLCPSRCCIEFLKFNECAYAGCIPVGLAPHSYPEPIRSLFIKLRPTHLFADTLSVIFDSHQRDLVSTMRRFLYETRNPDVLNSILKDFIFENTIHTS